MGIQIWHHSKLLEAIGEYITDCFCFVQNKKLEQGGA